MAAATRIAPVGRPPAPAKPAVEALDRALRVSVAPAAGVTGYRYECSGDKGTSWPGKVDVAAAASTTGQISNLTNGVDYVCRAFAENDIGISDASPISDSVKPCAALLECNGVLAPILGILGIVLVGGLIAVLFAVYRDRQRGYVVAVVDVIHTANLGHGSHLGIAFIRAPGSRTVTGIVPERGPNADIRVRYLRGDRFEVTDGTGRHVAPSGEPIIAVVAGVRHQVVLRAFATNAASLASSGR
jgi:hypothetical protein